MRNSIVISKNNKFRKSLFLLMVLTIFGYTTITCQKVDETINESGKTFYLDSQKGSDQNDGLTPKTAWQSCLKASSITFGPGDKLLFHRGYTFNGKLHLKGGGQKGNPVIIDVYGQGNLLPVIDGKGYIAAIHIENGRYFEIRNINITSDAGEVKESAAKKKRYGVLVTVNREGDYAGITLKNLNIHHIFASEQQDSMRGQNPTSNNGVGISVSLESSNATLRDILIDSCTIEMTGHRAIPIQGYKKGSLVNYIEGVDITNNVLKNIGGPGIVLGKCRNVNVRGNTIDGSGSLVDPRMHGRGSCIWPGTCQNVLIEKNRLMHARGKNDSCGAHIDYDNINVIVQFNLSLDNEGGFVEILGNNYNCAYRYNISINDGFRVKGQNNAALEGKVLWISNWTGEGVTKKGPFNSYIYNNTIFVKEGSRSCFCFLETTRGLCIANNIFYILGTTLNVSTKKEDEVLAGNTIIENLLFRNNLLASAGVIPASIIVNNANSVIGNPLFNKPGGFEPSDYIPTNTNLIRDRGINIEKLPGDTLGLWLGLEVKEDFFGNPISGLPDIGAIEIQTNKN